MRDDFEVNNSQRAYFPCVYQHERRRLWYFVRSDDYAGLGAEVGLTVVQTASLLEVHHEAPWILGTCSTPQA